MSFLKRCFYIKGPFCGELADLRNPGTVIFSLIKDGRKFHGYYNCDNNWVDLLNKRSE